MSKSCEVKCGSNLFMSLIIFLFHEKVKDILTFVKGAIESMSIFYRNVDLNVTECTSRGLFLFFVFKL